MYASRLSMVSSHSDYPSDLSSNRSISLKQSMLGLTESPLPRSSPAVQSAPSTPGSLAPPSRVRETRARPRSNLRQSHSAISLSDAARSTRQIVATQSAASPAPAFASPAQASTALRVAPSSGSKVEREIHRKPVPTPQSEPLVKQADQASAVDEWEEELLRGTNRLQLHEESSVERLREEQRKKDAEWERSGVWEREQNAAREAEDRTRRDAGREIAYPPPRPRVPVRAGASGVTSVHLGVRPRLHPSNSAVSIERNQPNYALPPPLFSPASHTQRLPGEAELLRKAQEQYNQWLSKKQEREGGIGGGEGWGTHDWTPRDRAVARPAMLQAGRTGEQEIAPMASGVQDMAPSEQTPLPDEDQPSAITAVPISTASSLESGSDHEPRPMTPIEPAPQQWYDPYAAMWQGYYPYDPSMWPQYGWDQEWPHEAGQSDPSNSGHVRSEHERPSQGEQHPYGMYDAAQYEA